MADLMTATANYTVLENKYGNFVVPAMKIKSSGRELISSLDLSVTELMVTLSLETAGMAIIKIADAYDVEGHKFDSKIKNSFKLGTVMEIELGYLSYTTPVFKGSVAGVGAEFDSFPLLVIKLMDVRKLMMSGGTKNVLYDDKNYSDVFKKVMKGYSKLCSVSCDATNDRLTKPISQSTNDYNFVKNELLKKGKSEREFFVFLDKAYFRIPGKNKTPIMTVNYGRELLRFSMMADYLDMNIEVVGYDPINCQEISFKSKVKSPEKQAAIITPSPTQLYVDADADNEAKAKTRAEAIAKAEVMKTCFAEGELIGLPEIVPGRYIKVDALEDMVDKKYYISEVVHTISGSRFTTVFETKGWI